MRIMIDIAETNTVSVAGVNLRSFDQVEQLIAALRVASAEVWPPEKPARDNKTDTKKNA